MAFNKDVVMQKVQRFGGAMFTPVLMFGVFGIIVALSILCKNPMILGSIAEKKALLGIIFGILLNKVHGQYLISYHYYL